MNALKHGMAAEEVVLPGEDPAELRASHKAFVAAWDPVGAIEAKLVWEITIADWRLRRARRMEPIIVDIRNRRFNARQERAQRDMDAIAEVWLAPPQRNEVINRFRHERRPPDSTNAQADDSKPKPDDLKAVKTKIAESPAQLFFDSTDGGMNAIQHLLRYETAFERSYYRAIHTLERVQAKRMGMEFAAPSCARAYQ